MEKIFYYKNNLDGKNPQFRIRIEIADTFLLRLRGLMLRSPASLPIGTGLLIAPCNSVHMMFMRFAIDVVYLTEEYRIVKVVQGVRPWIGISACLCRETWAVLELPAGSVSKYGIISGGSFCVSEQYMG